MMARQLHHHPAWTATDLAADLLTERDRLELMAAENLSVDSQRHALALNREPGNRFGEANALNHLGIAQQAMGEYEAAAVTQQQALRLYRDLGHRMGEANVLIAWVAWRK